MVWSHAHHNNIIQPDGEHLKCHPRAPPYGASALPLAVLWYKLYTIKCKVQIVIFLKMVLKKCFEYYRLFVEIITVAG